MSRYRWKYVHEPTLYCRTENNYQKRKRANQKRKRAKGKSRSNGYNKNQKCSTPKFSNPVRFTGTAKPGVKPGIKKSEQMERKVVTRENFHIGHRGLEILPKINIPTFPKDERSGRQSKQGTQEHARALYDNHSA